MNGREGSDFKLDIYYVPGTVHGVSFTKSQ